MHSALDQRSLRHARSPLAVIVAALVAVTPRAALAQLSDVKGSKDHPMVSRYPGSVIIGYDFRKFDEFVIPLGVLRRADDGGRPTLEPTRSQKVEGRVTRILYTALSERRAVAVVKELTTRHGIAGTRLKPAGVGMLSPVAPNDGEEGRAKNRRVELVKQ
jgi:hypothetical protein